MKQVLVLLCCIIACSVYAMSPAGDTAVYAQTFCSNQIIVINNNIYGPFKTEGIEVIVGGAYNGLDSVFKVMLRFEQSIERDYEATICEGDSILINNRYYHQGYYKGTETFENVAANGCDSIVNVTVNFRASPFLNLIDTLCSDAFMVVNGTRYDQRNRAGLEILRNASYLGCDSLVYISLFFREQWVYLGEDKTVVQGDTVCIQLNARYNMENVAWSPPPPCATPDCTTFCTEQLASPTRYQVTYTDTYGCVSRDDINIKIDRDHRVFGPNVFNPTGDEPNNRFFLGADRGVVRTLQLVVFDRWGEVVFRAEDIPNDPSAAYGMGWDGRVRDRVLPPDVFGWWAELENFRGERFIRTGDVTIVR